MEKLRLRRLAGFLILSILMFSCSNELHMTLPEGPQGSSAYDIWVEQVNNGSIKWDKNNVDLNNFFLYLKGADGKDGQNGVDGKSAYQLWIEQVNSGLDNPHNTGTNWSTDKVSMQDFWYFLTGAKGQNGSTPIIGSNGNWFIDGKDTGLPSKGNDGQSGSNGSNGQDGKDGSIVIIGSNGNWFIDGVDTTVPAFGKDGTNGSNGTNGANGKSAYELWVEEVAKGLEDPHNPGTQWDKSKTTTNDFWEYLRGADGNDGKDGADGSPGEIGKPGQPVTIVKGKPNVIAQYSAQEFSEYVRWTDGGVAYIVYDDQGSVSPGAKVKGLPGVLDPTKIYTADANGQFIVPKEDLPLDKTATDRFGATTEVEYLKSTGTTVKEVSASNTYVPSRVQIRLIVDTSTSDEIVLINDYMYIPIIVQRKLDLTSSWDAIPAYLSNLSQKITQHELADLNDPSSYTTSYRWYYNRDISKSIALGQPRMVKQNEYISGGYTWDNKDHYFTFVLNSYYGEMPHLNAVIKMAPIQYMPLITNIMAYNYSLTLNVFSEIKGVFDFTKIDNNLIFKSNIQKESRTVNGNLFDYYYPITDDLSNYTKDKLFITTFEVTGNLADNSKNPSSISEPNFTVSVPYLNSDVSIQSSSYHFKTIGTIGTLTNSDGVLTVVGTKNSSYAFPDIPVQQVTE